MILLKSVFDKIVMINPDHIVACYIEDYHDYEIKDNPKFLYSATTIITVNNKELYHINETPQEIFELIARSEVIYSCSDK